MDKAPVFMLVEPSPILQSVLQKWLQDALHKPCLLVAENGVEALRLAAQENPSHVLIELNLPDRTGFETLRQLRLSLPAAKIIATGWSDHSFFLDRIRSAGADEFVLKDKLASELLPLWEIPTE